METEVSHTTISAHLSKEKNCIITANGTCNGAKFLGETFVQKLCLFAL